MLPYLLSTVGDTIQMIIRYNKYLMSPYMNATETTLVAAGIFNYNFGNISFIILLLIRIKSSLQISKQIIHYLSLLLFVYFILSIWLSIVYIIHNDGDDGADTRVFYLSIITPALSIIEFLSDVSLWFIFIYKIKNKDSMEGMENINDNHGSYYSISEDIDTEDHHINDKRSIWNVMIKHCVLFAIAISSNQSFWVTTLILTYHQPLRRNFGTSRLLIVRWMARSVSSVVNIIILWLVLKINNEKYICLCKCLHTCVLKNCMKEDPNVIAKDLQMQMRWGIYWVMRKRLRDII